MVGPIPAASIERYADRYDYDDDELVVLRGCVRAMDRAFLQHVNHTKPRSEPVKPPDRVMETAMTPELFKKIFGTGKSKRR